MFYKLIKDVKNRDYSLIHNNKKIDISIKRLTNSKDYINNLVKVESIIYGKGYFKFNEKAFSTFGLKFKIDIIWVNWDGKVIYLEKNFLTNKISKVIENTKFIYILNEGTIDKNKILNNDLLNHEFIRRKK